MAASTFKNGACYFPPKLQQMKRSDWLTERPNLARNTKTLAVCSQPLQPSLHNRSSTYGASSEIK